MRVSMDAGNDSRSILSYKSRASRFREEGIAHSSTDTLGIYLTMPGPSIKPQVSPGTTTTTIASNNNNNNYFTVSSPAADDAVTTTTSAYQASLQLVDPVAGGTYLILIRNQNRALACYNGKLSFEDEDEAGKHAQWTCTRRHGFFGFRNVAEETYLGHDVWWGFQAKAQKQRGWECFKTERRPGGGYWLQALYFTRFFQVSAREDGRGLFAQKGMGTLWKFELVP